ncbi:MAG: hypothetical protein J0L55_02300 [Caulobacterales bacterium]|nr:hypothetical protein [Caulobacterales bacterium]MCA0372166.1 hypothetical protein [Pseudomonadota bacterium]
MDEHWYTKYDGTPWENYCHKLLHIKHGGKYQPIEENDGGDGGLDGWVFSDGIAYQMYGMEFLNKNRHKSIRSKIYLDLNKLKKNKILIEKLLSGGKINEWVLLINSPIPSNKINQYAAMKSKKVRAWGLPFISNNFTIKVLTPDYLEVEHSTLNKAINDKIDIPFPFATLAPIEEIYQDGKFITVQNKYQKITPDLFEAKKMALEEFKSYFQNGDIMEEILRFSPMLHEEISNAINSHESRVNNSSKLIGNYQNALEINDTLLASLRHSFGDRLHGNVLNAIARFTIAGWYIDCPLDFKVSETIQ